MEDDKNVFEKIKDTLTPGSDSGTDKTTGSATEQKEGSGLFTSDGKELPKIDGGYDLIEPDSGLGENNFTD